MENKLVEFVESMGYEIDKDMVEDVFSEVTLGDNQVVDIIGIDGEVYFKGPGKLYICFIPDW